MKDEIIIKQMNEYKSKAKGNIHEGVFMREKLIEFIPVQLFEGKVEVMLPESFKDMPKNLVDIKYPGARKPDIIKSNEEGTVNFTFSLLDVPTQADQVGEAITQFQMILKNIQPSNVFYEKKIEDIENNKIGWFDYKSSAVDAKLYNVMYIVPVDGKALHGVFNCVYPDFEIWKPVVMDILHAIKCPV